MRRRPQIASTRAQHAEQSIKRSDRHWRPPLARLVRHQIGNAPWRSFARIGHRHNKRQMLCTLIATIRIISLSSFSKNCLPQLGTSTAFGIFATISARSASDLKKNGSDRSKPRPLRLHNKRHSGSLYRMRIQIIGIY